MLGVVWRAGGIGTHSRSRTVQTEARRDESAAKRTREGKGTLRFPVQQSGWQFSSQRPASPVRDTTNAADFLENDSAGFWVLCSSTEQVSVDRPVEFGSGARRREAQQRCAISKCAGSAWLWKRDVSEEQALQTVQAVQLV